MAAFNSSRLTLVRSLTVNRTCCVLISTSMSLFASTHGRLFSALRAVGGQLPGQDMPVTLATTCFSPGLTSYGPGGLLELHPSTTTPSNRSRKPERHN